MKKLFVYLFYLIILLLPLYILNYLVDKGLRKTTIYKNHKWNDIYDSKINADVIVMGASRAERMVSTRILDSILNVNSYNLGMDGWYFNMEYAMFRIYLQHNKKPQYIIQNIDPYLFYDDFDAFKDMQFAPYLYDTILKNTIDQYHNGKFTLPEVYIPLFKYNNHIDLIRDGIECYFGNKKNAPSNILSGDFYYKGYSPHSRTWDSSFTEFQKKHPEGISTTVLPKIVNEFDWYLNYCNANNIKVIFEFAPVYYEELVMEKKANDVIQIVKGFSKKYGIPILDYSHDTLSYNRQYFYNSQHLNKKGSEIFSTHLGSDLKNIIQPNVSYLKMNE